MTRTIEDCGCKHDGRQWVAMCQAHADEFAERHLRAAKEKSRAELVGYVSLSETRDQLNQE